MIRSQRPTSTESAIWTASRDLKEGDCGCDSLIVDETAPIVQVQAIKTGSPTVVQLTGVDPVAGVKRIIWSADRSWDFWNDGTFSGGTAQNGSWIAEIPASSAGVNDTIWIGLVDSSGNADIRELILKDIGTVGVAHKWPEPKGFSIGLSGKSLLLNNVTPGSISVNLVDLRGRLLYSIHTESLGTTALISLPDVARGSYLLSIETFDQRRDVHLIR